MAACESDGKGVEASRPLVAFDFDGTLTWRDSFVDFLAWRAGPRRFGVGMLRLGPAILRYRADRNRDAMKAAAVREFLDGAGRADLESDARRYATARSARLLRPDALAAWRRWRDKDARLIIVTASPEITVTPFARDLAAERLIGSRLVFDAEDRVAGGFVGPNCRGPEKVVRLREALGPNVRLAAAYGDSAGDKEMLAIADAPHYRVFGVPK